MYHPLANHTWAGREEIIRTRRVRRVPAIVAFAAAWLISAGVISAAGVTPPASLAPALPGGCSFYVVIDTTRGTQAFPAVERLLPTLPAALGRLAAAGVVPDGLHPSGVALTGFLREDTVHLAILLGGGFDEAAVLRRLGPKAVRLSSGTAPALYQAGGTDSQAVTFLFPGHGVLAAGRGETLRTMFHPAAAAQKPPALLLQALAGGGFLTLFADQRLLSNLFEPSSSEKYQTLRRIFAGITELAWTLDSPREGRCRILLRCRQAEDAATIGVLLRNYLNLALLTAGQDEAEAAAILQTARVEIRERHVEVGFALPPAILEEFFRSLFNF